MIGGDQTARCFQVIMFHCGARVGFFRGDVKLLLDDIQELKPTYFPTVPRLLNRIYNKVSRNDTNSFFVLAYFPR